MNVVHQGIQTARIIIRGDLIKMITQHLLQCSLLFVSNAALCINGCFHFIQRLIKSCRNTTCLLNDKGFLSEHFSQGLQTITIKVGKKFFTIVPRTSFQHPVFNRITFIFQCLSNTRPIFLEIFIFISRIPNALTDTNQGIISFPRSNALLHVMGNFSWMIPNATLILPNLNSDLEELIIR